MAVLCLKNSTIEGISELTKLKLVERVKSFNREPFTIDYRPFSKFSLGYYWDYDLRRERDTENKVVTFWALHDGDEDNNGTEKYFEPVVTNLDFSQRQNLFQITNSGLLAYNFGQINEIVERHLLDHELVIDADPVLAKAIVTHTGGTLSLDSPEGRVLLLSKPPPLKSPMVVWRSLSRPLVPNYIKGGANLEAKIGDIIEVTNSVWSTSYDPISSYGFAMADETENHPDVYMMKIKLDRGFNKGWFVENTYTPEEHTFKQQFEYSIFGGRFKVINYYEQTVNIPDSLNNLTPVFTRFYELVDIN